MPTRTVGHRQSQVNAILTEDKNNLLTASAAAVNNMGNNIKSRSECTQASEEIFMISGEKTPPSTPFGAKSKVRQMENMLETVLGLSNKNIPFLFILTI